MAHNMCCDSYHVYNVTYIYNTIVPILGVKYVTCVSVLFPGTHFEPSGIPKCAQSHCKEIHGS